jgi:hypothetical protein
MPCDPELHTPRAGVKVGREEWPRYPCCGHRVRYPYVMPDRTRKRGLRAMIEEPFRRRLAKRKRNEKRSR